MSNFQSWGLGIKHDDGRLTSSVREVSSTRRTCGTKRFVGETVPIPPADYRYPRRVLRPPDYRKAKGRGSFQIRALADGSEKCGEAHHTGLNWLSSSYWVVM